MLKVALGLPIQIISGYKGTAETTGQTGIGIGV